MPLLDSLGITGSPQCGGLSIAAALPNLNCLYLEGVPLSGGDSVSNIGHSELWVLDIRDARVSES
ncbi:MAG TPA: hypothetical protein DCG12_22260, partial [Planctomycetaceae bacterium]|nr:hypothetical protein [Planctomycetaceae bacterium]